MKKITYLLILTAMFTAGFLFSQVGCRDKMEDKTMKNEKDSEQMTRSVVFSGGCFWCTESDFEKIPGVVEVISGYTGGHVANPSYEQVSAGVAGHVEAIKVIYDPAKVSYEDLLNHFWRHVDPTDGDGQFVDRGSQYLSAIFYGNETEKTLAEGSKKALEKSGVFAKPIVTEIRPLGAFYAAEDYHQDYYKKNPIRYKYYRHGSGRDKFLETAWKNHPERIFSNVTSGMNTEMMTSKSKPVMTDDMETASIYNIPGKAELKKILTPMQYKVTQEEGTEPPFDNKYWDNHEPGIFVDIVSGEPLFSSTDKYESGTGWPSFTKPLEPGNIVEKEDRGWLSTRTEVRSKHADSHLGHVFNDGPAPTGLRYCMNSAALRFIPAKDLETEGYGEYAKLFK